MPGHYEQPLNRRSLGQQVRLPDLQRLPNVGSDMQRQQASAIGRTMQNQRDELMQQLMQKRREHTVGGDQRNAAQAQARFLSGKVRNMIGNGPRQDLSAMQRSIHTIGRAI